MNNIIYSKENSLTLWSELDKKQIENAIKLIKKMETKKFQGISKTDWNVDSKVKREYFDYLWDECLNPFKKAFVEVMKGNDLILHNYWFQRYSKNDYHQWHTHAGGHFTNILYLQNTEDCPTKLQGLELNKSFYTPGKLLTFPAWVFHTSEINKTKKEKIIVSFNTSLC